MNKEKQKLTPEELAGLLHMRRRGYIKQNKKGKGSYNRKKEKEIKE